MAVLEWDKIGERIFQTGVDRGVLYPRNGAAVPWNGIIDVEESSVTELKSYYLDGVKFLESLTPGDYSGKLKAFTYPEAFDAVMGIADVRSGLSYYEQPPQSFSLSYRTRIGNDLEGSDFGYKIHILYNLHAQVDSSSYGTLNADGFSATEFSWSLTGTPVKIDGYRPMVHITIDSRTTPPGVLKVIEKLLYGTDTSEASLPPITEIGEYFGILGALVIVDSGDGTWTALDLSDNYITMLNPTTFQIANADAIFLDADTYEISSTNVT